MSGAGPPAARLPCGGARRARHAIAAIGVAVLPLLAACVGHPRTAAAPVHYDETGLATWYGASFAGRPTASGERFDPDALTAAHRTLPFGSLVEVTALATGRAIVVPIIDRGPWHRDRLIDLSRGAARLLGIGDAARVRVKTVSPGTRVGLIAAGRAPRH